MKAFFAFACGFCFSAAIAHIVFGPHMDKAIINFILGCVNLIGWVYKK